MQAYGENFARLYDLRWSDFAHRVAPTILDYYAATPASHTNKSVLDICYGTGQLAVHFLQRGYRVVGIDLSEPMLALARANVREYRKSGRCEFLRADASKFSLSEKFGLVTATYDSLNHLEDESALKSCFQCVFNVCLGYFVFDLNTRKGLMNWNGDRTIEHDDHSTISLHGHYDGHGPRAIMRIVGLSGDKGRTEIRFEETVYNTMFELSQVKTALLDVGWSHVHFGRIESLNTPLTEPEAENRVFVVARK